MYVTVVNNMGLTMKKFVFYLLFPALISAQSHAQEVGLLDDEMALTTDGSQNFSDSSSAVAEEQKTEEQAKSSWFGFITQPLSKFFADDEDITVSENKETETPFEKSVRQANEGNLEDQMNLAYMYLYGTNGVKQDFKEAFKYYELAAKQKDPIALNNLGSLYFNGIGTERDIKKALVLFESASALGNDNASLNLAFIYLTGGTKNEERNTKAMELFQKAADEGNKIAQFMVGYAYYKGFVLPQDYQKAFQSVRAAAIDDAKIDEAQMILSDMYAKGEGITQNYQKSIAALRNAAGQGNMDAIVKLAKHYDTGDICPKTPVLAHAFYNIAAAQNIPGTAKKRDEIGEKLNSEMITAAQQNAANFKAAPSELTSYIRQTYGKNLRYYIDTNMK